MSKEFRIIALQPILLAIAVCLLVFLISTAIDQFFIWQSARRIGIEPSSKALDNYIDETLTVGLTRDETYSRLEAIGPLERENLRHDICSWNPYDPTEYSIEIVTVRIGFLHPFAPQRELCFDDQMKLRYVLPTSSK